MLPLSSNPFLHCNKGPAEAWIQQPPIRNLICFDRMPNLSGRKQTDMSMVKLTIDGKEVITEENTTILQAARSAGIKIPTLCYHERLNPIGSCGLCVVEISGYAEPVEACSTPVAEGMAVITNSDRLLRHAPGILEIAFWFIIPWIVRSATKPANACFRTWYLSTASKRRSIKLPRSHAMWFMRHL